MESRPSNPLQSDDPADWQKLIVDMKPPRLLLFIERRMSSKLRARYGPEDIYQEGLIRAWGQRETIEWRGVRAFQALVRVLFERVIVDLANFDGRQKRDPTNGDGESERGTARGVGGGMTLSQVAGASATPSRAAIYRERAVAMQAALNLLSEEHQEILRMRIIEDLSLEEIAVALNIGIGAGRHRLFKAAEAYTTALNAGKSRP